MSTQQRIQFGPGGPQVVDVEVPDRDPLTRVVFDGKGPRPAHGLTDETEAAATARPAKQKRKAAAGQ